jgi:hypothetical protein
MMKRLIPGLALAALPLLAGHFKGDIAPIALYTQFQHEPSAAVFEAVRGEVESIMNPSELQFDWRSLPQHGNEMSVELAVITFKGRCETSGVASLHASPGALGWTHMSDGVILPFAEIDCDRIRMFVQRDLSALPVQDRERIYGRAVGRVLAHELYHILANTPKHESCGIGKSAYTVQELLSDEFLFEGHEPDALRANRPHSMTAETVGAPN